MADLETRTSSVVEGAVLNNVREPSEYSASNHSEDDDYVITLRPPIGRGSRYRKNKSVKHFSLQLRDDDFIPRRSRTAVISENGEEEILENGGDDVVKEKEKEENWTKFFSFRRQPYFGDPLELADADEFESDNFKDTKSLILTKTQDDNRAQLIQLSIKSPYLQEKFRKFIAIQYYHSITISASTTVIGSPFAPLYHHIEDINSYVTEDEHATDSDRTVMSALYSFVKNGWPAQLFDDVRGILSQGFITYDEIWALYRPGDLAVTKDPVGHLAISRITSVKYEHESELSGREYRWYITLVHITHKSGEFRRVSERRRIAKFADARKITDLDFYPLAYHERREELKENALERGKAWKKFFEGEPKVMTFEGEALPLVMIHAPSSTRRGGRYDDDVDDMEMNTHRISSSVIVDPGANSKAIIQASIDDKARLWHQSFHDGGIVEKDEVQEFTDEDLMICPASISIFSLNDHDWYSVDVAKLKEKVWRPKAFERLVLDKERKETLIRLASTNSRQIQSFKSKDVIKGKGKGMILLLHGPPGVGKTLTAEVLSEYTKRPLLKINLGRIASHKQWEQSLEQTFSNAEDWKAILLIDEAEIVLEKRTFERMTQNSWISVFLRKLEYYQGILILTTNLIDCIDEAFESRISYPIRFRELSREDRHQIWSDFINAMSMLPAYKQTLLKEVDRWSEAEINGRQIRNVILMAENLASSDEKSSRLLPSHIEELLNVTLEFCDYNQNNAARIKKIQFSSGPSY